MEITHISAAIREALRTREPERGDRTRQGYATAAAAKIAARNADNDDFALNSFAWLAVLATSESNALPEMPMEITVDLDALVIEVDYGAAKVHAQLLDSGWRLMFSSGPIELVYCGEPKADKERFRPAHRARALYESMAETLARLPRFPRPKLV